MRTYEAFLVLIAELDGDLRELDRVSTLNARAWDRILAGANDPVDWGGLAFTLHTLYGIVENYFLRVSKFFENNLSSEKWHRELVEKMALDVPGLRPPVFTSQESLHDALELLKFRHRIRNLYGEDLNPIETREIQSVAERFLGAFPSLHASFREKLLSIAEAVR